jgi:hypothetical protein
MIDHLTPYQLSRQILRGLAYSNRSEIVLVYMSLCVVTKI